MHQAGPAVWSPDMPEEYHGPHLADRRSGWERIEWVPVVRPAGRARVLSHTCACLPTVYELCGLGGAYFIRRTTRGTSATVVHDSAHVPAAQAGDLWFRLLGGRAR